MTRKHFLWVKESELPSYAALGWRVSKQRPTHHHHFGNLIEWDGQGEPPLPQGHRAQVRP